MVSIKYTNAAGMFENGLQSYNEDTGAINARTVTAGSTKISVTNGNGVSGNPTVDATEANFTLDNLGGTLSISKGGTGQTTQTAAFDALAPTTTKGDVIVNNGTDNIRVAVGANDTVLTADSTEASGVKFATPSKLSVTAVPSSNLTASGMIVSLTANENQAFGDICYINSDGEAQLADASAIATCRVMLMCADATISADATGNYLIHGIARQDSWAWSAPGVPIYATITGTSTNTLSETAPSGSGECVIIVGIATHADRMLFSPNTAVVELA